MKLLAIDTSTDQASIALDNGREVLYAEQKSVRQHAQVLLPLIESLLLKSDLQIQNLDGLVFGRGPGSFTGLRIACSITKALAFAHDLPVYPVSSLSAIAWEALKAESEKAYPVLAVLDARMGEFYWAYFENHSYCPIEYVTAPQEIILPLNPLIVAGSGYEKTLFSTELQQQIIHARQVIPKAQAMLEMVQKGIIMPVTPTEAAPIYIRNNVTQGEKRG